jgi:hypothetical protein
MAGIITAATTTAMITTVTTTTAIIAATITTVAITTATIITVAITTATIITAAIITVATIMVAIIMAPAVITILVITILVITILAITVAVITEVAITAAANIIEKRSCERRAKTNSARGALTHLAQRRLPMNNPGVAPWLAILGVVLAGSPAFAQTKPAANDAAEVPTAPVEASLAVGALQVGSAANLVIAGIDIHVEKDSVTYSYFLKNGGPAEVAFTAAVSLPELQASGDRSETWALASNDPENFVGLTITSAGAPVTTKAEVHAYSLGLDRLAEIKAEHLPLIPFGPEVDKTLAALSPDAAGRLAALGLISLREAGQKTPPVPDWTFSVVRAWRQVLPPGKTTPVVIKFTPVKGQYRMAKGEQQGLDDMKDDFCLKPETLRALQSRLQGNGAWKVTEIALSDEAPARWIESPRPTISVQKPKPDVIVAFCGMDDKSAGKPSVFGAAPEDNNETRVVMFEPATN